ncbi:nuclear pore complex component-domain-containing protein [Xylaria curta]|nr:nuclear pore complex component-domain-containing protein [Xylaria curta]
MPRRHQQQNRPPQPDFTVIPNHVILARLDAIEQSLTQLISQTQCRDADAAARLFNSRPLDDDSILKPLYSPRTNEVIPNFPRTKFDLENLTEARLAELLAQLGQPAQGNRVEQLRRLKFASSPELRPKDFRPGHFAPSQQKQKLFLTTAYSIIYHPASGIRHLTSDIQHLSLDLGHDGHNGHNGHSGPRAISHMAPTTAQTAVSTPTKAPATPVAESPGTWRHPRLREITRRQEASTFTDKNIKHIIINILLFVALIILHSLVGKTLPTKRSAPRVWTFFNCTYYALLAVPLCNIAINLWPLFRSKDDISDIPLTPGQRKLLGLPPSSAPPTPGSAYSTPPRYARTSSGSVSMARRSFSSSPILNRSPSTQESPTPVGNGSGITPSNYHLLQRAVLGARRSSISSPSPLGVSISTGASIFGSGPETPSPSPTSKRSSVGVNNKWRYNKGMYERAKGFRDLDSESIYA